MAVPRTAGHTLQSAMCLLLDGGAYCANLHSSSYPVQETRESRDPISVAPVAGRRELFAPIFRPALQRRAWAPSLVSLTPGVTA